MITTPGKLKCPLKINPYHPCMEYLPTGRIRSFSGGVDSDNENSMSLLSMIHHF